MGGCGEGGKGKKGERGERENKDAATGSRMMDRERGRWGVVRLKWEGDGPLG